MTWLYLTLVTAFSSATADTLTKRALRREDPFVLAWVRMGYALPFVFTLVVVTGSFPQVDAEFLKVVAVLIPFEVVGLLLYVHAIKLSPLSLTLPFLAFTPAFTTVIAFFLLDEIPSWGGLLGIGLITIGAYTLHIDKAKEGLLEPVKAVFRERGSLYMLLVAFIYGINSTLGKMAALTSSPLFYALFYPLILTLVLTTILIKKKNLTSVVARPTRYLPIGFFTAIVMITHFSAVVLTNTAYMIAVKRTSLLFGILYGRLVFGEEGLAKRLTGGMLMVAGVFLVAIFQD